MKNIFKLLGIVALVAAIGFGFTACSDDDGGADLAGTWTTQAQGLSLRLLAADGEFTIGSPEPPYLRGTYTSNSITPTHMELSVLGAGPSGWTPLNEVYGHILAQHGLTVGQSQSFTISGNTLTLQGQTWTRVE